MRKQMELTDAEWTLMEALWNTPGLSGRELSEAMEAETGWSRSTTLTLLRRLVEKGAVERETAGTVQRYAPTISRKETGAHRTRDLLDRVYHGSLPMLVSAMTESQALSDEEIRELYAILDELEAKGHA